MFAPLLIRRPTPGATLLSAAMHTLVAAACLLGTRVRPVQVFSLPGTATGTRIELAYLPGQGRPPVTRATRKSKTASAAPVASAPEWVRSLPLPPDIAMPPKPHLAVTQAAPSDTPPAAMAPHAESGSDSWGAGSIQIALTTFSPSPAPDLSTLPHGVQGDVVVDVTIDPTGKVADLAILRGLGYGIESSVLGTLKTWTFRPATKDGTPIASVQELHFHFGPA